MLDNTSHKTKPKRPYNTERRQAQAAETRRLIAEAARRLFISQGYAGATIQAIAREAGVAAETVYATFGSKRAILAHLIEVGVGGDEEPVPILQRPGPQAVKHESNQHQQIRLFAGGMRQIMERVSVLFEVMRSAAKSEPEIAETLQRSLARRLHNLGEFVQWLVENGPLRAGLSPMEAAETVWAISSAEIHLLLTAERGWSGAQYEQWLGDTLIAVLLPPGRAET